MTEALRQPAATPQLLFLEHGGEVDYRLGRVHLYIDAESEEAWIDLHCGWRRDDLGAVLGAARRCQHVVMDEHDGVEEMDDGRIRQWLVQSPYIEELTAVS